MPKVGVIGHGRVGADTARFLARAHEAAVYDPAQPGHADPGVLAGCVAAFVCVPTPALPDGGCDVSAVEAALRLPPAGALAVVRSTVPPDGAARLRILCGRRVVFWPETLAGESAYPTPHGWDRDAGASPHFVIGGDPADTAEVVRLLLPCGGPHKRYIQTAAELACLSKYLTNAFGALKVAFCYELAEACRAAGIDWHAARELWLLDPRIGPDWTAVFDANTVPYGGKCLPKDIAALLAWCRQAGHDAGLLAAAVGANERLGRLREGRR